MMIMLEAVGEDVETDEEASRLLYVNTEHIVAIFPMLGDNTRCHITLVTGDDLLVRGSIHEIRAICEHS